MAVASATMVRHPHASTLELLQLAIDALPPFFPKAEAADAQRRKDAFMKDASASYDAIHDLIAELGKRSWAQRKAYEEMFARYGRASEEAHLLDELDAGIRAKYERFLHEGGKLDHIAHATSGGDIWKATPFERAFTPEEKFVIERALLAACDKAREEIRALVADAKREEYERIVRENHEKERRMEHMIAELRGLADVSQKWRDAILDRVRTLQEGWSVVEQGVTEKDLEAELDHWQGTLESFLRA
jgi:hypothetical protein